MSDLYRVKARPPKKNEGKNYFLVIRAPSSFRTKAGRPRVEEHSSKTDSPTKAEAAASELEARLNMQLRISKPGGLGKNPSFIRVFDSYVVHMEATKAVKPRTIKSYKESARAALAEALADVTDENVSSQVLLVARDNMLAARKLKPNTANIYLAMAKVAWTWAKERGHVTRDWPRFKRLKSTKTKKRPMQVAEQEGVIEYYRTRSPYWHAFFALAQAIGARSQDQTNLREGVNLKRHAKPGWSEVECREMKREKLRRVFVPNEVVDLIPVREHGEFLFPARNIRRRRKGLPVGEDAVLDALRRALVAIGVADPENIDFHSFRRSQIADLEEAGVTLRESMAWMAHSSIEAHETYKANAPQKSLATAEKLLAYRRTEAEAAKATKGVEVRAAAEVAEPSADRQREQSVRAPNSRLQRHLGESRTSCSSAGTGRK